MVNNSFRFSRVLVTGGCGFIGSHYIENLNKSFPDTEILNIDACTYAASKKTINLLDSFKNYSLVRGNICDEDLIRSIFIEYQPNLIVNFAAESHVDNSIDNPNIFLETNILGTANLLRNIVSKKVAMNNCIFHHISTDEVFGDMEIDSNEFFTETSLLKPSSPYSASKACSEHLVRAWSRTYGIQHLITNCGNNFGPRQHHEKLIPKIILSLIKDKKVPIYGDGKNIRDWIHVSDHVDMLIKIQNREVIHQTYLIGMENTFSNLDILKTIKEQLGKDKPLDQYIEFIPDRLGHDRRYALRTKKIREFLDEEFKDNFKEDLLGTIQWYKTEEDWWD